MGNRFQAAAERLISTQFEGFVPHLYGGAATGGATPGIGEVTFGAGRAWVFKNSPAKIAAGDPVFVRRDIMEMEADHFAAGISYTNTELSDLNDIVQKNVEQMNGMAVTVGPGVPEITVRVPGTSYTNPASFFTISATETENLTAHLLESEFEPLVFAA